MPNPVIARTGFLLLEVSANLISAPDQSHQTANVPRRKTVNAVACVYKAIFGSYRISLARFLHARAGLLPLAGTLPQMKPLVASFWPGQTPFFAWRLKWYKHFLSSFLHGLKFLTIRYGCRKILRMMCRMLFSLTNVPDKKKAPVPREHGRALFVVKNTSS